MTQRRRQWRAWLPDVAAGTVLFGLGLAALLSGGRFNTVADVGSDWPLAFAIVALAAAVGMGRRAPGTALALLWTGTAIQVFTLTALQITELVTVLIVSFATARWGSRVVIWLGALSLPAYPVIAFAALPLERLTVVGGLADQARAVLHLYPFPGRWRLAAVVAGTALLAVPWLVGLVLRIRARAHSDADAASADLARAEGERARAREIARLRERQAQLARDVHDVVGHSLAVILAQAESGQFLPNDDPAALKTTLAGIADAARTSLRDVRQVLAVTREPAATGSQELDELLVGLRNSGHQVDSTEVGHPRALPPELAATAFRVLQEMLTNAMKYGRRDRPVTVRRCWPDGPTDTTMHIEVGNVAQHPTPDTISGGHGLTGMRHRLAAVGGRLDVRRGEWASEPTFTVTAWLPIRAAE